MLLAQHTPNGGHRFINSTSARPQQSYDHHMATPKRKTVKRATKAMSRKRRGAGKRELVKNQAGDFFARRTRGGQFKEMDELGRSLTQDRKRKAKTTAKRGQGDRGDRKSR
jgi:hypothetical protein